MAAKVIATRRLPRHVTGDVMEVAILRAIGQHKNIASLHSVYEYQRECYIVTE